MEVASTVAEASVEAGFMVAVASVGANCAAAATLAAADWLGAGLHGLMTARYRGSQHGPVSTVNVRLRFTATDLSATARRCTRIEIPDFSRNRNAATFSATRSANVRSTAVRNALNSRAVTGALHNRAALHDPITRAQIVATAATAGWHHGRGGWWRHRNGGYGWVGPLFWPFAYYDIYDYAMWGYGYYDPFWDYGYDDIYAGIFSPYRYDDLTGYWPQSASSDHVNARQGPATPDQLAQMCGEDSRDIAGLPIDQIQRAIQPNDVQRTALDELADASVKAARTIEVRMSDPDRADGAFPASQLCSSGSRR